LLKLNDVINENMILLDLEVKRKEEVINALVDLMYEQGKIESKEDFLKSVYDREELLSTYCGSGIAIPHGISDTVREPGICFARINDISWSQLEEKVHFVFLLAVPSNEDGRRSSHLKLLSAIAVSSLEEDVRKVWKNATSKQEILESLKPTLNKISDE